MHPRLTRLARYAATVVAVLLGSIVAALAIGVPIPVDERMVLRPPPTHREPVPSGVAARTIVARDGVALRTWTIAGGDPAAPWILMNYGNAGDLRGMLPLATWFARTTGATAVLWEYRGFGTSGGSVDFAKTRDDALRVYDDVHRRSVSVPWVYGVSYGTTVAAHIAHERPLRGVILHAPPSDAMTECLSVRDRLLPWPLRRLRPVPSAAMRAAFAVAATMRDVRAPLIVLHGTADALIPIAEGRAVERAAGARAKRFVAIPNAAHGDVRYDGTPAGAAIAAFMRGA